MNINEREIWQYHYDAKYKIEGGKFLDKINEIINILPIDDITSKVV